MREVVLTVFVIGWISLASSATLHFSEKYLPFCSQDIHHSNIIAEENLYGCNINEPNIWKEERYPDNGDVLVFNGDNLVFHSLVPLKIAAIITNSSFVLKFHSSFSVDQINGQNIQLKVSAKGSISKLSHKNSYAINGDIISMKNFIGEYLSLYGNQVNAQNITSNSVNGSFTCDHLTISEFFRGDAHCRHVVVGGRSSIYGNIVADTIDIKPTAEISVFGSLTVIYGIIIQNSILELMSSRASVTTSVLNIAALGVLKGRGTIHGHVSANEASIVLNPCSGTYFPRECDLTINGDLFGAVKVSTTLSQKGKWSPITAGKIIVLGKTYLREISIGVEYGSPVTSSFEISVLECDDLKIRNMPGSSGDHQYWIKQSVWCGNVAVMLSRSDIQATIEPWLFLLSASILILLSIRALSIQTAARRIGDEM